MIAQLTYRIFRKEDLDAVLDLWKHFSGWGEISRTQFRQWYLDTPNGACIIVVAVDEDDQVVGQEVLIPSRIWRNGSEVKAVRLSAPILHESVRGSSINKIDHPAFGMIRFGIEFAQQQGYKLVYGFPAKGWTSLLKMFPRFGLPKMELLSFGCFAISLADQASFQPQKAEVSVTVVSRFTDEYNGLWNEARKSLPIKGGVVRDRAWLQWKLGGYIVLQVHDRDRLVGYVAIKNTGLLTDILARTEDDLELVLMSSVHKLHRLNAMRVDVDLMEITGMHTPTIEPVLRNIQWSQKDFEFTFACYPFDEVDATETVALQEWYLMPND